MRTEQEPQIGQPLEPGRLASVPDEAYYRRGEQARRWGSLLLVVGVIWLVFALAGRGSFMPFGFAEREVPIPPQRFSAERVVISGANDRIELVATTGDEIVLEGSKYGFGWNGAAADEAVEALELVVNEQGDTLAIEVRRPSFSSFGRTPYAELRIALPPDVIAEANLVSGPIVVEAVRGDLALSTISGDVDTSDTSGALTVRTTSGDVRVAEHSGALDVETMSGDVEADGALTGIRANTVSGSLELEDGAGTIEATTISGEVVLEANDASLRIESTSGDVDISGSLAASSANTISNISGDVRLQLDEPGDLRLDVSTVSGELDADLPLQQLEQDRRGVRGEIGAGTTSLTISTTSGDIAVTED